MKHANLIAGQNVAPRSGAYFADRNPANPDDVLGEFPRSNAEDVDAAVSAAEKGFAAWRKVPVPARGEILGHAGDILKERKEETSRLMAREMGKTIREARGDVQEAIDTAYYAAGEGRRLFGRTAPSELPSKATFTTRRPIGVAGLITPWNFPIAIPSWKALPALLCGNSIVLKPASDAPACGDALIRILLEAGVEPGALNLVHGGGTEVGSAIVRHNRIQAISFTGSSAVGRELSAAASATLKRTSLELGGKNAVLVAPDADFDHAMDGVVWGAFGSCGQRCTTTSRLLLHESMHDRFVDRLCQRAAALVAGDPVDEKTDIGPLVNRAQLENVQRYVEVARKDGATIAAGGSPNESLPGFFFHPTIVVGVTPTMRIAREEVFGPVLAVLRYRNIDEALEWMNATEYGLSSSIYTRDVSLAFRAIDEIEAGITYVNGPTIGAECHMPFGGVRQTGNGHREGGWGPYEFYSEVKTVYVDYSGRLQRAQIDNR